MVARVKSALDEGRIEDDLKDVRMEKVISLSTKQAMIARVCVLAPITFTSHSLTASAHTGPSYQSLHALYTLRSQEQHTCPLP